VGHGGPVDVAADPAGNVTAVWMHRINDNSSGRHDIWSNRYVPNVGWGAATLVETVDTGDAWYPQVVVDLAGDATAVWTQDDGTRIEAWSNRFMPTTGWGLAELIETYTGSAENPQVAIDPNSNATMVWSQHDGARDNIWATRYTPALGWEVATLVETDNIGNASDPQVGVDSAGNATAVWRQHDGTWYSIWSSRYRSSDGWGTPRLLESEDLGDAWEPQVAVDINGNVAAVWFQYDGGRYNVWASQYTAGVGWAIAALLETDDSGDALRPQVAMDANGNATAVWSQRLSGQHSILSSRYAAGVGWGMPVLIETDDTGNAHDAQVAVNPNGDAVAVWRQDDGSPLPSIWSNRYTAGVGWDVAELIEADDSGPAVYPQVAIDPNGNAVAAWRHWDGIRYNIWSNRYAAGAGWGLAELLETADGAALDQQVTVHPNGNAVAVWKQRGSNEDNIWSNRYTAGAGWGGAQLLETNERRAFGPQVTADPNGDALVVWHQAGLTWLNIWSNRLQ